MNNSKSALNESITHFYKVFSAYTTQGFYYCDCGCTDETDVRELLGTPLRALSADVLLRYNGDALYTQGGLNHYKHFLPRLLELEGLTELEQAKHWSDVFALEQKLAAAEWTTWPKPERAAVHDFWVAK